MKSKEKAVNTQIEAYLKEPDKLKYNLKELIEIIKGKINPDSSGEGLDIGCASGVLSIFDEFETPLKKWLSWLSNDGLLFIFGRFNSRNVDTKILFRNNTRNHAEWEGGLSAFSVHTITSFLNKLGYKCEFKRFILPIDIKEDASNPIRTFTKELKTGGKIVMDGANIVAEHFFVVIGRDLES